MEEHQLENLLATFLQEMKEENDRLQSQLKDEPPLDKRLSFQSHLEKVTVEKENEIEENKEMPFEARDETKDHLETSIAGHVLHLYNRGIHVEEIAKRLNRGKTEVELIVKMQKAIVKT